MREIDGGLYGLFQMPVFQLVDHQCEHNAHREEDKQVHQIYDYRVPKHRVKVIRLREQKPKMLKPGPIAVKNALKEAKRLAIESPEKDFYVLEPITKAQFGLMSVRYSDDITPF